MKKCNNPNCKETNPKFSKYKASKDGLRPICKECDRLKYIEKKGSSARRNVVSKQYSLWTLEEENRYRELFYLYTTKKLMDIFNKSKFALLRKAQELKLKKPTYVTKFFDLDEIPKEWDKSGVYAIINSVKNKIYIGSSVNILQRLCGYLRNGFPKAILDDFKIDTFKVAIIKFCDDYLEQESLYLNNPTLYNSFETPEWPILSNMDKIRFKKRYKIDGNCWLWLGYLNDGYGKFIVDNIGYSAHKISYMIHKGVYNKNLKLRHTCPNKHCVNPDHLIPGTDAQNCNDRKKIGRANSHGTTWDDVQKIRADWLSGLYSLAKMKEKYGFNVQAICFNKSWYDPNYIRPKFTTGKTGFDMRRRVKPKLV